MSHLGLTSLKRKNLPIVVTLGGIGSCYASLAFYLIAFNPSYKLCNNKSKLIQMIDRDDRVPLLKSQAEMIRITPPNVESSNGAASS
jgi:hypothetical protein